MQDRCQRKRSEAKRKEMAVQAKESASSEKQGHVYGRAGMALDLERLMYEYSS